VYCDQAAITGTDGPPITPEVVASDMRRLTDPAELCYFGGSFARQDAETVTKYLDAVLSAPFGSVVTFSSYPGDFDGSSGDLLISTLKQYPIGTIELGIPSLDEDVLAACHRDGGTESIKRNLIKLRDAGFHLGAQIMIGLPGQSPESSASDIGRLGAIVGDFGPWDLRIYPCLVLRGTELEVMYREENYSPLTLEEAARQSGVLLRLAKHSGFRAIRVGLPESESLRNSVIAGPYHPAFGELALSEATALELAEETPFGPWKIDRKKISHLTGHGGRGIARLSELTSISEKSIRDLILKF
jgi:histone acetyltransferase (RNA polymerase elongator complex component)